MYLRQKVECLYNDIELMQNQRVELKEDHDRKMQIFIKTQTDLEQKLIHFGHHEQFLKDENLLLRKEN